MAEVKPFKGYRYALEHPEELQKYVSPPYDMIDEIMIEDLYNMSEYNSVRIIQNKRETADSSNRDRHRRAASFLKKWIEESVIKRDEENHFYIYRQIFSDGQENKKITRTALTARVKLTDYGKGVVQPHEYTLTGPKNDRLELLEETKCNTGQIFGIATDNGKLYDVINECISDGGPLGNFTDEFNVTHEIYHCSNRSLTEKIEELMKDRTILIADGHHRYETALAYSESYPFKENRHVMMSIVSMSDPGLIIRPFHRLVKKNRFTEKLEGVKSLEKYFKINDVINTEQVSINSFMRGDIKSEFLFFDKNDYKMYALDVNENGLDYLNNNNSGMSARWNSLSVSRINLLCVEALMGHTPDGHILHEVMDYVKGEENAFKQAAEHSDYSGAFFIRPVDIEKVKEIVSGGERMPQKSTNFFPKLYSGLIFNMLERK